MSDRRIVERLRQWPLSEKLAIEAADRIEALEAALRSIASKMPNDFTLGQEMAMEARAALMQRPGQHADQRQGEQPEPDHKR